MKKGFILLIAVVLFSSFVFADTVVLRPISEGYYTGWGSNCRGGKVTCVDEYPSPDTGDYIFTSTGGAKQTFIFENATKVIEQETGYPVNPVTGYNVSQVVFYHNSKRYDSLKKNYKFMVRDGSSDYYDPYPGEFTSDWYTQMESYYLNPVWNTDWNKTAVEKLQAGWLSYFLYPYYWGGGYVSQVFATVTYALN